MTPLSKRYPAYFPRSSASLKELLRESLLVFDASVLLNLYRHSAKGLDDFRKLLLPEKARIWLVDQVALEYVRNRRRIVGPLTRAATLISAGLEKNISDLTKQWEKASLPQEQAHRRPARRQLPPSSPLAP